MFSSHLYFIYYLFLTQFLTHLRAAVHSKNKNSDIWTEVIQGLRSNNLERSSR